MELRKLSQMLDKISVDGRYLSQTIMLPDIGLLRAIKFGDGFYVLNDKTIIEVLSMSQWRIFYVSVDGIALIQKSLYLEVPTIPISETIPELNGEIGLLPLTINAIHTLRIQGDNKDTVTSFTMSVDLYESPKDIQDFPDFNFVNQWQEEYMYPFGGNYRFPINGGFLRRIITSGIHEPKLTFGNGIPYPKKFFPLGDDNYYLNMASSSGLLIVQQQTVGLDLYQIANVTVEGQRTDKPVRVIRNVLLPVRYE